MVGVGSLATENSELKWLVTGANGMLGSDVVKVLSENNARYRATDVDEVDITDVSSVNRALRGVDIVVNTAAWTDVPGAEDNEDTATAINGLGPGNLASLCKNRRAVLIHLSTDYVMNGEATTPYSENEETSPINAYGRSKAVGERFVTLAYPDGSYIVRTAWLYGASGNNFVKTMLSLAAKQENVKVVADQFGQPTWSYALAERLVLLGHKAYNRTAPSGIYHGVPKGHTSWFKFAKAIFDEAGLDIDRVKPCSSSEFPSKVNRPKYTVLSVDGWQRADLGSMEHWRSMLHSAMPIFIDK